jgi:integrase
LRSLCDFAVKRGWLRTNPATSIKLRAIKGDGFHTWSEEEIAQFEAHHPVGSKPRLALLLYTAQRRSDVVRIGRQHIRDGVLTVKQDKTGVTLAIPVHPELRAVLDAMASEHLTFLITATSKPYATHSVSNSETGATLLACRNIARRTGCARQRVADSPKPGAAPTRSWRSAVTRR